MKKLILLLFVTMGIGHTHAQTNTKDSIKQLLQNEKRDTGRVLLLADLSRQYIDSKPDTTLSLAMQGLALSRRIGFEKGEAASLYRIGNAFGVLGNYPGEIQSYLEALKINERINNLDGIQRNYSGIGIFYRGQGEYRKALVYLFKAKELAEKLNNTSSLAIILINIGEEYYGLKIYDSALLFMHQGYNVASAGNYTRTIGVSNLDEGHIHFETGKNSLALEYYRLSVPFLIKAASDYQLCQAFLGMAKVFEKMGENDSALFYANQELRISKEKRFTRLERDAARFLSSYYKNRGNTDSAFFYSEAATVANDSIFSQQKLQQIQSLDFDEKLRQQQIAVAELKAKQERKNNLQYAAIALGLITFIILFLLVSHSIVANQKLIKFLGILGLLIVFELINLFIHPYLENLTHHSPLLMLTIMVCIAALLIPIHHWLEKWITHRLVEKNKKIRLAAAKKTIATLEGDGN